MDAVPKLFYSIKANFGLSTRKLADQYVNLTVLEANWCNHRIFNIRCLKERIIPSSLKVKPPDKSLNSKKACFNVSMKFLRQRLHDSNIRLEIIRENRKKIETELGILLDARHLDALCSVTHERYNKQMILVKERKAASEALNDLTEWLKRDGEIAVFDATNTTRARREMICKHCANNKFKVIFVESICDNQDVIEASILEVKVNSPDYVGVDKDVAMQDFMQRINHYTSRYEPIDDELDKDLSYIKIFNQGQRYLANRITGNINSRIVYYLMNINVGKRTIYLVRHGESEYNLQMKLGGDSPLSERGWLFAEKLAKFMQNEEHADLRVWTSHMRRAIQTSHHIQCSRLEHWKALDELDGGICEGMTYEEIQGKYPLEFSRRDMDKFYYRYPMGESYQDLVARLEPVIMELERQQCVLVICHQAVARCLLAYFLEIDKAELPYIKVPLHTVFKMTPTAYRCIAETVELDVPAVDTHRSKPTQTESLHGHFESLQTVAPHY